MKTTRALALLTLVAVGLLPVPTAAAQSRPQTRSAFWFNGGIGFGTAGGDCCSDRKSSFTVAVAAGGTVNRQLLLGASVDAWARSEHGAWVTIGAVLARMRWYPSATGGFFLTAGVGLGRVTADATDGVTRSETGGGVLLGLGYDILIGNTVSLTPFWNGFATHAGHNDSNVGQLGLSFTVH